MWMPPPLLGVVSIWCMRALELPASCMPLMSPLLLTHSMFSVEQYIRFTTVMVKLIVYAPGPMQAYPVQSLWLLFVSEQHASCCCVYAAADFGAVLTTCSHLIMAVSAQNWQQ